jgi:hypothetical protein
MNDKVRLENQKILQNAMSRLADEVQCLDRIIARPDTPAELTPLLKNIQKEIRTELAALATSPAGERAMTPEEFQVCHASGGQSSPRSPCRDAAPCSRN